MKIAKCLFCFSVPLAVIAFTQTASHADTRCAPDQESLYVTLNSPFGCVTENLFKRQMDVRSDLATPRAETPPDTHRRINTLSEWRQAKPTQSSNQEKPQ